MKLKADTLAKALQGIETDRQLPKQVVEDALVEALTKAYRKHIEIPDAYVRVDISPKGVITIYHERMVVDDVEDDELEISVEDAKKFKPDAKPGDMIDEEVDFTQFDRAAVVLAKNVMKQKIREAEKAKVYEEYSDKVNDMVNGVIDTVEDKFILVSLDGTIAMMKKSDQIPTEHYREGQEMKVVITEVNKETKGAQVLVSRSSPVFVKRLFERDVPEIYNGVVEIKAMARDAGERCKIAVKSNNENIDPIGACIGPKGTRVQNIINELHGEKVDIFEWSDNIADLIKNALSPSEAIAVFPNEAVKDGLVVVVPDNQLSLAIGKRGKNARLAVRLSGRKIDIKAQSEMDEAGIDYMGLAKAMQDEYEDKKAKERAYKQQEKIDALRENSGNIENVDVADFTYVDEPEELLPAEESLFVSEQQELDEVLEAPVETVVEEVVETKPEPEPAPEAAPRELDEMELAAKLAKEKRKEHPADVKGYTSKFEDFATAHKVQENTPAKKKKWGWEDKPRDKDKDKKEFKPKPMDDAMKPIYSEEELAEIEAQDYDHENWDDDVDYEEYDSFYD